jgi:dTDP-glucose 4,6-dehydratase
MKTSRLLITGGSGFIGSALVRSAVRLGHEVLNFDSLTYAASPEAVRAVEGAANYEFVRGDVRDAEAVRAAVTRFRPDAIIHLAAESHVDRSIDTPGVFIETNVVGSFVMLNEALRHWESLAPAEASAFRFIQVSTDEVFGSLGPDGAFDEHSPYAPNSPYSASKASGDHLARAWHATYGLPVVITNCSNNYGPFQFPEKLIPLAIQRALRGEAIPVYGDGRNVRDWLFVDDHAAGLLAAVERGQPGRSYLFGGRAARNNLEVIRAICDALDAQRPEHAPHERIQFVTDRPGHDRRYAIDPSFAERELGWRASHSFEQGISETVAWYVAHTEWMSSVASERYAGQRLGARATR